MRPLLDAIVQSSQAPGIRIIPVERGGEQEIGKEEVLRQERAMEIGADRVALTDSFRSIRIVVPVSGNDGSEGLGTRPEVGSPGVVLESGDRQNRPAEGRSDRDRSDETVTRPPLGSRVEQPESLALVTGNAPGSSQELEPPANGEDRTACPGKRKQGVGFGLEQIVTDDLLIAILTSSDVDQVDVIGVEPVPDPGALPDQFEPPPLASPSEEEQVSPIGVDVQFLGIEGEDPNRIGQAEPAFQ